MAKAKKKISPIKIKKPNRLFSEIKTQIEQARVQVAVVVNQSLTHLYWNIGSLISHYILDGKRAAYGKEIIATLSQQLSEFISIALFLAMTNLYFNIRYSIFIILNFR